MTKSTLLFAAVLGTVLGMQGQAPQSAPAQTTSQSPASSPRNPAISVQQDVAYGTAGGSPLALDIYDPGDHCCDLRAAVVLIDGGDWSSFDKSIMRGVGMFLARSGFVAFSVVYRLLHGTEDLWPAQLDDVQRAVRWIRANAAKYQIDPDPIGAFGHSAGAQWAGLLGMEDTRDNSRSSTCQVLQPGAGGGRCERAQRFHC